MKKSLYSLILLFLILLSCKSTKNELYNKLKLVYNQENNTTNIYNDYYVEKISLNGKWEFALDYVIKNKIKSHQTYLTNNDTIIGLLIYSKPDDPIQKKSNNLQLSRYIEGWNYAKIKYEPLKTDNKTFDLFRLTKKNKSIIHLIGYRNELNYHITIYEPIINDKEKIKFLIDFYKTLKP